MENTKTMDDLLFKHVSDEKISETTTRRGAILNTIRRNFLSEKRRLNSRATQRINEKINFKSSTASKLNRTPFDAHVDNGYGSKLNDNNSLIGENSRRVVNRIRGRHKMSLTSLSKAQKDREYKQKRGTAAFKKQQMASHRNYMQNRNARLAYGKNYNQMVKTGQHQAATRRKY